MASNPPPSPVAPGLLNCLLAASHANWELARAKIQPRCDAPPSPAAAAIPALDADYDDAFLLHVLAEERAATETRGGDPLARVICDDTRHRSAMRAAYLGRWRNVLHLHATLNPPTPIDRRGWTKDDAITGLLMPLLAADATKCTHLLPMSLADLVRRWPAPSDLAVGFVLYDARGAAADGDETLR